LAANRQRQQRNGEVWADTGEVAQIKAQNSDPPHIWSLIETICRNLQRGRSLMAFSAAISSSTLNKGRRKVLEIKTSSKSLIAEKKLD
jgi:hypothetical protein